MTPRRTTPYDDQIPPDLWVEFPRADLRLRLIEAVLTIARLRGATSLDVQEAPSVKWDCPGADFGLRRTLNALPAYDLAYTTVQPIVLHQKIGLFRLTERGRKLARALGVEPIDNGWVRSCARIKARSKSSTRRCCSTLIGWRVSAAG